MSEVRPRSGFGAILPQLWISRGGEPRTRSGDQRLSLLRSGGASRSEILCQLRGAPGSACRPSRRSRGDDHVRKLRRGDRGGQKVLQVLRETRSRGRAAVGCARPPADRHDGYTVAPGSSAFRPCSGRSGARSPTVASAATRSATSQDGTGSRPDSASKERACQTSRHSRIAALWRKQQDPGHCQRRSAGPGSRRSGL